MIQIISGTNRPGSLSLQVSRYCQSILRESGSEASVLDLAELSWPTPTSTYKSESDESVGLEGAVKKISEARGLVCIVPEYNGSYPGILKYFIDHWKFPESFEYRPVAFIGLGGRFGGLRPVEHLQQVFGYRNAFVFPQRVFVANVYNVFKEGRFTDSVLEGLVHDELKGFVRFIEALESYGLDANSRRK